MIIRRALPIIAVFGTLCVPALAQEVLHGADSLFIAPSVKVAWAVQRGASEAEAAIVIRIADAGPGYRFVRLDGVDPFTKDRQVLMALRPLDRVTNLTVPRARLADHPSTEIHFFASAEEAAANRPKLTIFYLSVPDTTPEFSKSQDIDLYFARRFGERR
jgi:hypothetical protein